MSTYSNAHVAAPAQAVQPFARTLAALALRWWVAYIDWRLERAAITHLGRMSDRELKDIGVSRGSMARAVKTGRPMSALGGIF